jgi:AraC-like DNA-binding protein
MGMICLKEVSFSPHVDFYISKICRAAPFDMKTFHLHKKYEIYYLMKGTRRYFIEDSAYRVNAGDIVLVDKDEIHKTGPIGREPHSRFVLNFNPEYLSGVWGAEAAARLLSVFHSGIKVFAPPIKAQGFFESALQNLYELSGVSTPESDMLRKSLLTLILLRIKESVDSLLTAHAEPQKLTNKTVDRVMTYLAENYREQLSLKGIASKFYISPYYLSHLFKKFTSLSLVEYINSLRIREAKKYLETTTLKISEISEKTGFSTSAHFSRMFKQATGFAPNRYRKFCRKSR